MTDCTPAQARELANAIQLDLHVSDLPKVLRSLADQVEALTAERDALKADAARYRWLRDESNPGICAFYLSVGKAFDGVKFNQETVDAAIDAQMKEPK